MLHDKEEQIGDLLLWRDADARELLQNVADKHDVKLEAVTELLSWMQKVSHKGNKMGGLNKELDQIFENNHFWNE